MLVLGLTGRNFGAGMTGGTAYVWDPEGKFVSKQKFHPEFVECRSLSECDVDEQKFVRELLQQHIAKTGSRLGQGLPERWHAAVSQFQRVGPKTVSSN